MVSLYRLVGPVGPLVAAVERGLLSRQTRATDPDAVSLVGDGLRHANRRGMYTAMRSVMLARPDLTPVLSDIAAPTLIVTGDELPVLTPSDARSAAAKLPHGTSAVIAATRHLAPLEASTAVVELVAAFWRGSAGSGGHTDTLEGVRTGRRSLRSQPAECPDGVPNAVPSLEFPGDEGLALVQRSANDCTADRPGPRE
jgi:hypothetical protein